jgi:hypothetical protein
MTQTQHTVNDVPDLRLSKVLSMQYVTHLIDYLPRNKQLSGRTILGKETFGSMRLFITVVQKQIHPNVTVYEYPIHNTLHDGSDIQEPLF